MSSEGNASVVSFSFLIVSFFLLFFFCNLDGHHFKLFYLNLGAGVITTRPAFCFFEEHCRSKLTFVGVPARARARACFLIRHAETYG